MWETVWITLRSNPSGSVAVIVSMAALGFSIFSFIRTRASTLYSDIDARYMDLLKLGITNPEFVNPDLTKKYTKHFTGNDLLAYQQYAFAAWNIIETIIDRHKIGNLSATWVPVIKTENRLHRVWLNNEANHDKFKDKFWKFMINNPALFPCPDCEAEARCKTCTKFGKIVNGKSLLIQ